MPRFDEACHNCAWEGEITARPFEHPPCPRCGHETHRVWKKATSVAGDEIPGGTWIENLGDQPMFFETKSAIVKEAHRRGLEPMVRHVPVPGTDKSPHTSDWSAVSPYQLEAAREMLERIGRIQPPDPEPIHTPADVALVKSIFGGL